MRRRRRARERERSCAGRRSGRARFNTAARVQYRREHRCKTAGVLVKGKNKYSHVMAKVTVLGFNPEDFAENGLQDVRRISLKPFEAMEE